MAPLTGIMTEIGNFITAFVEWLSTILEFVGGEPILFVFVVIAVVSIVVGMIRSWIPGRA